MVLVILGLVPITNSSLLYLGCLGKYSFANNKYLGGLEIKWRAIHNIIKMYFKVFMR